MRSDIHTRRTTLLGALTLSAVVTLTGCGSSGGSTTPPGQASSGTSASAASSGPAPVEVNPAGDIPDNQAFVAYQGAGFSVTTPEGWARSMAGGATVFSDKYNSITIAESAVAQAPTVVSAKARVVPMIKAASKGFTPGTVRTVQRTAGMAVLITYQALSQPNPVTGKVANEAVEAYTFWKSGKSVTLTLAAPAKSDNVDPWRKVTDSFTWTN